jgi:hypothetical protein
MRAEIIMKRLRVELTAGSRTLLSVAVGCLLLAGLGTTPQTPSNTQGMEPQKKEHKEHIEQLIYSVKGPDLFRAHCAPCHGSDAKGGGPMATALRTKVPDLTGLAKNNLGKFPSERVRKQIIGDDVALSHGSREMPVWGPIFHQIEADQDFGNVRVGNLLRYLESIQAR